jgi:serine/threonine protein kinase
MRTCYQCGNALGSEYRAGICPKCLIVELASPEGMSRSQDVDGIVFSEEFHERYEFLEAEPFARGGQGEVFRVRDHRLRRIVALKRLPDSTATFDHARSRFLAEAQVASQLDHPGILPVFDIGKDSKGQLYLTTALLSGKTFGNLIHEVRASGSASDLLLRRALEKIRQVCNIMAFAHGRGVIHRDLKPGNILIDDYEAVFVIDWGSAVVLSPGTAIADVDTKLTPLSLVETDRTEAMGCAGNLPLSTSQTGLPVTLLFTPPELHNPDGRRFGPVTDIFAVGVMLYELITGRLPYSGQDGKLPEREELVRLMGAGPPLLLRKLRPPVSRDLSAICEKAMARDSTERYQTMEALAGDIRAYLEDRVVQARLPGVFMRVRKWGRRHSRQLALAVTVLLVMAGSGFVAYSLKLQNDHARQINELRDAQLSARNGKWRAVLDHLDGAEKAGYTNMIDLSLQRTEAWTVLGQPTLVQAQLKKLLRLPGLGPARGKVLLRLAEQEVFDQSTAQAGLQDAREALREGLDRADEAFAKGLLAETTPEALEFFHQALLYDPYHLGSHRQALALEFALGKRAEMESHIAVFQPFYPDDPSPTFVHTVSLALVGQRTEAMRALESTRSSLDPASYRFVDSAINLAATGAAFYEIDSQSAAGGHALPNTSAFLPNAVSFVLNSQSSLHSTNQSRIRLPQLPCMRRGLEQGLRGLLSLTIASAGQLDAPIKQIEAATKAHPEGLLLLTAGMLVERHRPSDPLGRRDSLRLEAGLFQSAAEMPSILPNVPWMARFLAAVKQLDLASRLDPPDSSARAACVANIRELIKDSRAKRALLDRCFSMALELKDADLAREALTRSERLAPTDDPALVRSRIQLEIATGAYGEALKLLSGGLSRDFEPEWESSKRAEAIDAIRKLAQSLETHVPETK